MKTMYRNRRITLASVALAALLVIAVFDVSYAQDTSRDNAAKTATDGNSSQDSSVNSETAEQEKKAAEQAAVKDPISTGSDERFIPSEEISEDLPVSFPVDI